MKNKDEDRVIDVNISTDNDEHNFPKHKVLEEWINEVKKASKFERAWRIIETLLDFYQDF
jgi:hypothetical protein